MRQTGVTVETKYADVKGIRTRYLVAGAGLPVVLVHGGHFGDAASANGWDRNIDGLARSFKVFALDKIGCGFTDNPRTDSEYIIGSVVQHVYDFMKTLGIDGAHLVGHSRGAYAVTRLALEHPEIVRTLGICSSATLMFGSPSCYDEWDRQVALISDKREKARFRMTANSFNPEHITEDYLDRVVQIMELPKTQEAQRKFAALRQHFEDDLLARKKEAHDWIRAGGIIAPTIILWGFNDPSAPWDPMGLGCVQLVLPHTQRSEVHVFNGAGHTFYREHPEAFVAVLTNFIRSYESAR